jgi:hypothetical protein
MAMDHHRPGNGNDWGAAQFIRDMRIEVEAKAIWEVSS